MKPFVRSDDYMGKIFVDALDREVHMDQELQCMFDSRKLRVWFNGKHTWVQFPTALRRNGRRFIADVIKCGGEGRRVFYRAYRGSIRDINTGEVVG